EVFKLAPSIDTPISPRPAPQARAPEKAAAAAAKPKPEAPLPLQPATSVAAKVEKREQPRTASERAEAEYRRGAALLGQGRVSEAESVLVGALSTDPAHEATRQALVALYIE